MISLLNRHALRTSIAIFFAVIVQHFFSAAHEFWEPLAAFLILQTPLSFNMRHALQCFLSIVFALVLAQGMLIMSAILLMLLIVVVTGSYYFIQLYSFKFKYFSIALLFVSALVVIVIPLSVTSSMVARLHDVSLGALVSFFVGMLFFRPRPDVDFRQGVIPIVKAYSNYLSTIMNLLLKQDNIETDVQAAKILVEELLSKTQLSFPEWVYHSSFVPSLQQGHRHFLMKIEQLGQVLFAMHYVARNSIDPLLLNELASSLKSCSEDAKIAMQDLAARLDFKTKDDNFTIFYDDLIALENHFNKIVSLPLALLDVSKDYIYVSAFIYDFKDLYKILVTLAEAIR